MFSTIKDIFRKRRLKRDASKVKTGLVPLDEISSYAVFLDPNEASCDAAREAASAYFRSKGIQGSFFYVDLRKIDSTERLITPIETTVTREEINILGIPKREKMEMLSDKNFDLLISLEKDPSFTSEYLVRTSTARFKVGRKQLDGDPFDLVVFDPADKEISQLESFKVMTSCMERIV